jgi:hypothetical protein
MGCEYPLLYRAFLYVDYPLTNVQSHGFRLSFLFLLSTFLPPSPGSKFDTWIVNIPGLYLFLSLLGVSCCGFIGFHFLSLGWEILERASITGKTDRYWESGFEDWNWNWTGLDLRLICAMNIILYLNMLSSRS